MALSLQKSSSCQGSSIKGGVSRASPCLHARVLTGLILYIFCSARQPWQLWAHKWKRCFNPVLSDLWLSQFLHSLQSRSLIFFTVITVYTCAWCMHGVHGTVCVCQSEDYCAELCLHCHFLSGLQSSTSDH